MMASTSIDYARDRNTLKEHEANEPARKGPREALPTYEEVMAEEQVGCRLNVVI